jgi:hypothetical protein
MAILTKADKGSPLTHNEMDNNLIELDKIPTGKTFPKTKGVGIKIDTAVPEFGWHDITGNLHNVNGALNSADYVVYRGGIKAYQFAEGEESFVNFHLPHDYLPGSEIFIHVHWSHNSSLVTGGSCTWAFETMYAKGHNQASFEAPVNISVIQNTSIVPYQHMIAETSASVSGGSPGVLLDTELLEADGIIQARLYLDSNDIITSNASIVNPFAHFVDIHYQSTGLPTKNKAPDFWT